MSTICLQQDFSQISSSATIAVAYVSSGLMGGSPGVFNDAVLCLVIRTGYVFMKVMAIFVASFSVVLKKTNTQIVCTMNGVMLQFSLNFAICKENVE